MTLKAASLMFAVVLMLATPALATPIVTGSGSWAWSLGDLGEMTLSLQTSDAGVYYYGLTEGGGSMPELWGNTTLGSAEGGADIDGIGSPWFSFDSTGLTLYNDSSGDIVIAHENWEGYLNITSINEIWMDDGWLLEDVWGTFSVGAPEPGTWWGVMIGIAIIAGAKARNASVARR